MCDWDEIVRPMTNPAANRGVRRMLHIRYHWIAGCRERPIHACGVLL